MIAIEFYFLPEIYESAFDHLEIIFRATNQVIIIMNEKDFLFSCKDLIQLQHPIFFIILGNIESFGRIHAMVFPEDSQE